LGSPVTDAVALTLIFVAILNPISGLILWNSMGRYAPQATSARDVVAAALVSFALLAIAALLGESLLEALDITPPSFQIATGVLLVLSVLMVFAPARDHADVETVETGGRFWPAIRMILWLASPAALAAAIGYRIEFGLDSTLIGIAAALAVSAAVLIRGRAILARTQMSLVVWIGRFIGAVVVVLAIDLIRRGVENV
jgi:small neutral amino acid transporter SnatA (MarC family)